MRYLILSDIHANLEALDAALATPEPWDRALVLGDLVGYGADPNAVVERVRTLSPATFIRGNHDKVAAGLASVEGFNHLARQAIQWTATALTADNRAWVAALAEGPMNIDEPGAPHFAPEICHGAPFDEDVYIFDDLDARRAFRVLQRPICLFGHTHVPAAYVFDGDLSMLGPPRGNSWDLTLQPGTSYLINVGAVGQPRDGDPRAAFGILDTATSTLRVLRADYDIASAQAKILSAGLPEVLAQRLAIGR
jgi:diadenosine tetraphosphatase ApaH/serine/threonine PP2A family protein phosphatase